MGSGAVWAEDKAVTVMLGKDGPWLTQAWPKCSWRDKLHKDLVQSPMYLFTRPEKSSALAYQPSDLRCHMLIGTASEVGFSPVC